MRAAVPSALVVDDDPASVAYIRATLWKFGFAKVYSSRNGMEALELVMQQTIGLVLADWQMPQMTGVDLLRRLKGQEKTHDIPVNLVTAEDRRQMVQEAIDAKADGYIIKPYSIAKIEEAVLRVLNRRAS